MSSRITRWMRICALTLLVMALAVTVASAWPPMQGISSEDAAQVALTAPAASRVSDVIGDDPDEDGYRGPQPQAASAVVDVSEMGSASGAAPDWNMLMAGPQPDQIDGDAVKVPDWSPFYYFNVSGSAFRPRDSASPWSYEGVGCISVDSGSALFTVHLDIPSGARIDYLRLYSYDANAANGRAWVTNYDNAGSHTDLINVDSTGNGGYGTTLSDYLGHVVDTNVRSYILNWQAGTTGSTMRLCGMRVAYRLPD